MPEVSVVMPSYNYGRYLSQTIESVLAQSFQDFELVIVDDGSSDNSAEIIKKYAAKDKRIKYKIFPKNKGACVAHNLANNMATGNYFAVINADDIWLPHKLERQLACFAEDKTLGAVFALPEFVDSSGRRVRIGNNPFLDSLKPQNNYEWMNYFFLRGNCVCHPTALIKKKCYDDVGHYRFALRSLPDFDMWTRMFFKYKVKVLDEKLIQFRKHDLSESSANISNIIRTKTEYKQILNNFIVQIKTINELEKVFPEHEFPVREDILTPFYLAQVALSIKAPHFEDFAFDILYEELEKPEVYTLLENNNLYSYFRLSDDVVKHDVYHYRKRGQQKRFTWFRKKLKRLKGLF